jgi:hypothetical protein
MVIDERERIELNRRTIREHLIKEFPGFHLTEDASEHLVYHRFTVTDVTTFEQYKLKVGWPRLSEITNNPDMTKRSLMDDDVIGRMRNAKGHYAQW